MKRRSVALFVAAGFLGLLIGMTLWRVVEQARHFDRRAIAVLARNHRYMMRLRALSGTVVWTDDLRGRERSITSVRLLKPNFARVFETHQERRSCDKIWRASPPPWSNFNRFRSDGVTLKRFQQVRKGAVVVPLAYPAPVPPARVHGANIPLYHPCLYGFFTPDEDYGGGTHFARTDFGRGRDCYPAVDFIRSEGRATVGGILCDVVTYNRTTRQSPLNFQEWAVTWAAFGSTGGKVRTYMDQTTLYVDSEGLIRRIVLSGTGFRSPVSSRWVGEWRNVRADPPLSPADFRFATAPTSKGNAKP